MIPSLVASENRARILDYLEATFDLADEEFAGAFFGFLRGRNGLFQGPFYDVRLPFRTASDGEEVPLEIRPNFRPYTHQLEAFWRLSSWRREPEPTLITTGTGSGKTEGFLYPILDHCWRHRDAPGVKAIILYPMNALASDQAKRIAGILWDDERLKGNVSAGLYVGGEGQHGVADRDHLIDSRTILRQSPPDILLTNYKMLDFLLLRPDDRALWRHNGPETLRYVVLDELHTYDGAQGSDVACLLRRLGHRLHVESGTICPVGTSATLGGSGSEEAVEVLRGFASDVFGREFSRESVLSEERLTAEEALGPVEETEEGRFPESGESSALHPETHPTLEAWLRRQRELWLGDPGLDAVESGQRLRKHPFLRQLLDAIDGEPRSVEELNGRLSDRSSYWKSLAPEDRRPALDSFLALVSTAGRGNPEDPDPFLTVQVQLWVRELRHLVASIVEDDDIPDFLWADEEAESPLQQSRAWLPLAHCRDCGMWGYASRTPRHQGRLDENIRSVGQAWFERNHLATFVTNSKVHAEEFEIYLCPECLRFDTSSECLCRAGTVERVPVYLERTATQSTPKRFLERCPECDSDRALSMVGSRAASLLSVAIGHLFSSTANQDKKLLAFTDSVQDASHRAGFFGARTYRFSLRTAIQGAIEAAEGGSPIADMSDGVWNHWVAQMEAGELLPTLWPADLWEYPRFEAFRETGGEPSQRLVDDLKQRLGWEVTREFGVGSRAGRTLEATLCSAVTIDPPLLNQAAEGLALEVAEEGWFAPATPPDASRMAVFLLGMLHRLRERGGIHHPFLESYVESDGRWYLLTKSHRPLMSPFGSRSVLPRFFTSRSPVEGRGEAVFDPLFSAPKSITWIRDWTARVLGVEAEHPELDSLFRRTVEVLEARGIVSSRTSSSQSRIWGLKPEHLLLTPNAKLLQCEVCRRSRTVSEAELDHWAEEPCPHYRCEGTILPANRSAPDYYQQIYKSKELQRIFSQEHTGLLSRSEREQLEEEFKEGEKPGAPNLFVATPTLEMGIDIGDLSAAVLCSVPPSPANYLQRIGRAGRETGNAFCLTMAVTRPHDQYFFALPEEMLAGQVAPPGCFLDAPEMLKRQLVAFGLDTWARDEAQHDGVDRVPRQLSHAKAIDEFQERFLSFFDRNRTKLLDEFFGVFDSISIGNRERIREFAETDEVARRFRGAFEAARNERHELLNLQRRTERRLQELEKDPQEHDHPEDEIRELEHAIRVLQRMRGELGRKYSLNVLTDAGVLPNYAFPESGVYLESVVGEETDDGKRRYESYEFVRPASLALRELAPFNTFYADGRKVRIDELDLGTRDVPLVEEWRFCRLCHHARPTHGKTPLDACPNCGDFGWSDMGQVQKLVPFRRSRSLASRMEASTADETEDRQEEQYETLTLIDVQKENRNGAKQIEKIPFGIELLKNQTLRELNLGPSSVYGGAIQIGGERVPGRGFLVCRDCGRVAEQHGQERRTFHAPHCRARKKGNAEKLERLHLYREVQSDALRILLPVSTVGLEERRANFKAALELGLRKMFRGAPDHLQMRFAHEPVPGTSSQRQFLVIFDSVPGGTGYLAELWHGENILDLLEGALDALEDCPCLEEGRDGCYRCLFAFQVQRDLPLLSNHEARELLREILKHRDSMEPVDTLSDITLEDLTESELERRFLQRLEEEAESETDVLWEEQVVAGRKKWWVTLGGRAWEIVAQHELGPADGVSVPSRADFLLRPRSGEPWIQPVAIFCDGFEYHALPGQSKGRIGDDILKRRSILGSGSYRVWGLTWNDLLPEGEEREGGTAGPLLSAKNKFVVPAMKEQECDLPRTLAFSDGFRMLLAYLRNPEASQWEALAKAQGFAWLMSGEFLDVEHVAEVEERLRYVIDPGEDGPLGLMDQPEFGDALLARYVNDKWLRILGKAPTAPLKEKRKDKGVRLIVRLLDGQTARESEHFSKAWERFLQGWNLLQFHPAADFMSSEYISEQQFEDAAEEEIGTRHVADDEAGAGDEDEAFEDLLRFATDRSRPLIQAIHDAGLPLPEMDVSLPDSTKRPRPTADLGWPNRRVAILAPRQEASQSDFEAAGWTVFTHPVTLDELLERTQLGETTEKQL